jgi:hypothetical protein
MCLFRVPEAFCAISGFILSRFYIVQINDSGPHPRTDTAVVTVVFPRSMAGYGTNGFRDGTVRPYRNARAALLTYLVRSICDASAQID